MKVALFLFQSNIFQFYDPIASYETETDFQILNEFAQRGYTYDEAKMILAGNHAPFVWEKNGDKAVYNADVLEKIAQMAYLTDRTAPSVSRLKTALIQKHHECKHGLNAYYGQTC
jgi:L-ribulose-5-phosphate 4-epimerase